MMHNKCCDDLENVEVRSLMDNNDLFAEIMILMGFMTSWLGLFITSDLTVLIFPLIVIALGFVRKFLR